MKSNPFFISTYRLLITFLLFTAKLYAGDQVSIRSFVLDENNIKVIVYNYGSLGNPDNYEYNLVWNENANIAEFGPLIAAELFDYDGYLVHIVSDSYIRPFQGDYDYNDSLKWGWLPVASSVNPNSEGLINYLDRDSWYADWKDWSSIFRNNENTLLNEVYYEMDDYSNAEFYYFPSNSDTNMEGLGIKSKVRVSQLGNRLSDAIFISYELINTSDNDLYKVYFGFQTTPMLGGRNNFSDNYASILNPDSSWVDTEIQNTIYSWDADGKGDNGGNTGILGMKFLKTPDNLGLTSFHAIGYTNSYPNVPANDELMWELLSSGVDYNSDYSYGPGNPVINFGTGPFTLMSGESTEVIVVLFFSDNFEDLLNDAAYIQSNVKPTSVKHDAIPDEFHLSQNYPNPFNPTTTIRFTLTKTEHINLKVFNTLGEQVAVLMDEELNAGNHETVFNSSNYKGLSSGVYYYRLSTEKYSRAHKMLLMK